MIVRACSWAVDMIKSSAFAAWCHDLVGEPTPHDIHKSIDPGPADDQCEPLEPGFVLLCQDCLRTVAAGSARCPCGGEVCCCDGCLRTLCLLRRGCLDQNELGIMRPIAGWTACGGVVPLEEDPP